MSNSAHLVRHVGRGLRDHPRALALEARLPGFVSNRKGKAMTDHKIGTRAEWQAARGELAKLEAEHAERNVEIRRRRSELPWVPVEKEYVFETEAGRRT